MNTAGLCRTLDLAMGWEGEDDVEIDDDEWWSSEEWEDEVTRVEAMLDELMAATFGRCDERDRLTAEAAEA